MREVVIPVVGPRLPVSMLEAKRHLAAPIERHRSIERAQCHANKKTIDLLGVILVGEAEKGQNAVLIDKKEG